MNDETPPVDRGPGRPRKFAREPALDAAMRLFWQQGYQATGVAALREAMGGMPSASFYALFDSKERLFEEAVAHYRATYGRVLDPLTDERLSPRQGIEQTLRDSIRMQTDSAHPLGCMMVLAAASSDPQDKVFQVVSRRRASTRAKILLRVEDAMACGDLPDSIDPQATVVLIYGFLMGISTLARDGVPAAALQRSVDALFSEWGPSEAPGDGAMSPSS